MSALVKGPMRSSVLRMMMRGSAITVAGNPMGSNAGHLVSAGDEVRDEFRRRAFPSAENNAEEVVGEPLRITEVLHGVFG